MIFFTVWGVTNLLWFILTQVVPWGQYDPSHIKSKIYNKTNVNLKVAQMEIVNKNL